MAGELTPLKSTTVTDFLSAGKLSLSFTSPVNGHLGVYWESGRHGLPTNSRRFGIALASGRLHFTRPGTKTLVIQLTSQGIRRLRRELNRGVAFVGITAVESFTAPLEGDRLSSGIEWLRGVEIAHPFTLPSN
jgi:hypothetical protein